jgi:hypothetical protein
MFPVRYEHHLHIKSKGIAITGHVGLQGCELLVIPHCTDSRLTVGGEVVSLAERPRSTPQKYVTVFTSLVFVSVIA